MATITNGTTLVSQIQNFYGLNQSETGQTNLKLGEASVMKNFRITHDYKLQKMYGYENVFSTSNSYKNIQNIWSGKLGETEVKVLFRTKPDGTGLFYWDFKNNRGNNSTTSFNSTKLLYEFNKKLYFNYNNALMSYDGTSFSNAKIYVPVVKITCTPQGSGTDFENLNMLSDYRRVWFSADGTEKTFVLPEKDVTVYSDCVKVDGTLISGVTYNSANGTVTLPTAPAQGVNNVEIQYKKNNAGSLSTQILGCNYAETYGLADDTRVFVYGNPSFKNRVFYSEPCMYPESGEDSAVYFPSNNYFDVGSSNTAVTNISRQYDRLIISKEDETYYSIYEQITDTTGESIVSFPTKPLNKAHGNVAMGQGQVLNNYVTTIDSSIVQWTQTDTKDERNASIISNNVKIWLDSKDLSKAITLDYEEDKEYWLAVGNEVMIYNYGTGTFYLLDLPDNVTCFNSYKGEIYFGTDNGKIMKFDKSLMDYNGEIIDSRWESGFYDFTQEYRKKTMRTLWITLKPQDRTSMTINYVSDRQGGLDPKTIQAARYTYANLDYTNFSYNTSYAVKPFKVKLKAKKFAFLKLIITNNRKTEKLIVNEIAIRETYGGFVK